MRHEFRLKPTLQSGTQNHQLPGLYNGCRIMLDMVIVVTHRIILLFFCSHAVSYLITC